MALSAHGLLHTGRFEHHLLNRRQKISKGKKILVVSLMLTSLVDMFSLLVCFLLNTFSASPEIVIPKGLALPLASSGNPVKEAPVLSINMSKVFLDQKELGTIDAVLKKPDPLVKGLQGFKQSWAKSNPQKPFPGEINFQADREVGSIQIAKVMGILNSQQYDVIQLAVLGQQ